MSKDPATVAKDPVLEKLEKALALEQQGKKPEALKAAQKIWEAHKSHPASLQAAALWTRLDSMNPEALFAMSVSYILQGRHQEAIQGTELVTRINPNHAQAWATMAIAVRSLGDLPRALELNEKSMRLDPKNLSAWANRLDIYFEQGEYEKGIEAGKQAVKLFPNDGGTHSNMARLYSRTRDHENANYHYKKLMQLSPQNGGLMANYIGHLREYRINEGLADMVDKCNALFDSSVSERRMYPMAWMQVKYMHALQYGKVLEERDRIVDMRDMEKIGDEYETLKLVDKSNPVWLYKAENLKCDTSDWAYYDDKNIFMNHKVTGKYFEFLMCYSIHDKAYIQECFPEITIEEPCLLLGGSDNYYHWLIDYLPRLGILDYHPELRDLPIYMNDRPGSFIQDSLKAIGIDPSRIKTVPMGRIATLKQAYIAHVPGRPTYDNGEPVWMKPNPNMYNVEFLRRHFLKDIPEPKKKKRYFISREKAQFRRCINEARIFEIAQEHGFEKLFNEGKSFMEQIQSYAEAEAIIGPHGAGFTNMVFSPKGTKIIEMFPLNREQDFYEVIAKQLDMPYIKLEGPIQRTFPDKSQDFGDFAIDENLFIEALKKHGL
jgi:tetratricopeptide (TPR) repeat protein